MYVNNSGVLEKSVTYSLNLDTGNKTDKIISVIESPFVVLIKCYQY